MSKNCENLSISCELQKELDVIGKQLGYPFKVYSDGCCCENAVSYSGEAKLAMIVHNPFLSRNFKDDDMVVNDEKLPFEHVAYLETLVAKGEKLSNKQMILLAKHCSLAAIGKFCEYGFVQDCVVDDEVFIEFLKREYIVSSLFDKKWLWTAERIDYVINSREDYEIVQLSKCIPFSAEQEKRFLSKFVNNDQFLRYLSGISNFSEKDFYRIKQLVLSDYVKLEVLVSFYSKIMMKKTAPGGK